MPAFLVTGNPGSGKSALARAVFVCGIARNQDKMLDLFETQMLRAGAVALDGTASTAAVADELLALADSWPVFGQG